MHGRAHLLLGAGLGVALSGGVSLAHAPTIGIAAVAALLPDLDHEHSDGTRLYQLASRLGSLGLGWVAATHVTFAPQLSDWFGDRLVAQLAAAVPSLRPDMLAELTDAIIAAVSYLVVGLVTFLVAIRALGYLQPSRHLEHRGALHWPSLGLVLGLVAIGVSELVFETPMFGLAFAVGWLSHLVGDLPTFYGMPLLKPFAEAPEHTHMRTVVFAGMADREPYACRNFHVTPTWLRWHSGHRGVELPIGTGVLALSLLATSVDSWLPLVAHAVTRG